ncbi:hypothetical protein PoB_001496200 [Plakobranchus ocellatus]|uniref:Uncharacterized protein n=1 Tax=Plakobranchus ocellatus TaxID=259542 RepID=A0AAV3YZT2_9GAST|nr:hypothetical protein PoB_001496200 [Plakobranchus ocellatus]
MGGDLPVTLAGMFGMLMDSCSTIESLMKLSEGAWELLSDGVLGCSFSGVLTGSGHVAGADAFGVVKTPGILFVTMAIGEGNVATEDLTITG